MKDITFKFNIADLNIDWWFDLSRRDNLDLAGSGIENINATGGSGVFNQGLFSQMSTAATGPSNRTVASFDDTNNQRYLAIGVTSDPANSFELTSVFMPEAKGNTNAIFSQEDGAGTGRSIMSIKTNGNLTSFLGGIDTNGTTNSIDGKYHVYTMRHNTTTNQLRLYVDGALEATSTRNVELATGEWVLGSGKTQSSNFMNGDLGEVLFVINETPDVIFNAYQRHLCEKWGVKYNG